MKFVKKLIILFMIIILVPAVSAGIFGDIFSKSKDFVMGNLNLRLWGIIVGVAVFAFLIIKFSRGGGTMGRVIGRGKKGGPGWFTTRKVFHENKTLARIENKEARIYAYQVDLTAKALAVEKGLGFSKYEKRLRSWAKILRSKIKKSRRVIARNLKDVLKNSKRSVGWRRYIPGGFKKGYINPNVVQSRLNQFFRNVVYFLQKNLSGVDAFISVLDRMEQWLLSVEQLMAQTKYLAKAAIAGEKKAKKELELMREQEKGQVSRAQRFGRYVGKRIERTKAMVRIVNRERKLVRGQKAIELKIRRKAGRANRLIRGVRTKIDLQTEALKSIAEIRPRLGEDIAEFENNARILEKDLRTFKGHLHKDVMKLYTLTLDVRYLESKLRKKEVKVEGATDKGENLLAEAA